MLQIQLVDVPQRGLRVEHTIPAEKIQPEGAEAIPCKDLSLTGNLMVTGEDYLFSGEVSGAFEHVCDRCLEMAKLPFSYHVDWLFTAYAPEAFSEDEDEDSAESQVWPIEGDMIDLGLRVWEEVAIATPDKFLCREDCNGLCAHCGANLNTDSCQCDTEFTNDDDKARGLAALADLYPDLAPESNKESNHAGTKKKNG